MTTCAIVPVRSLADGKRRLAGVLDDVERAALNERFLVHALDLAAALPGPTFVISLDPAVASHPAAEEAIHVVDPDGGLNAAIEAGRDRARLEGAERIVVLPIDLPTARPEDVQALAGAESAVAIAPDRRRQGTNGLCLAADLDFAFRFGAGSFPAHVAEAERLGVEAAVIENPRLALDIDTPEDWRDWCRTA